MVVSMVVLRLSERDRRNVIASLKPLVGSTRTYPACRGCFLLFDSEDPRKLVLWEEWDTQEDLDRHVRSRDYRVVLAAIDLSQAAPEIHFDTVTTRPDSRSYTRPAPPAERPAWWVV